MPSRCAARARRVSQRMPSTSTLAGISRREAFADLDRRRLAGAVRAEQPEALAGVHLEVEAVHGDDVLVRLTEIANV